MKRNVAGQCVPEVTRRREALTHPAQPSSLARPLLLGFPFGFFPDLRCAAPHASAAAAASQHTARSSLQSDKHSAVSPRSDQAGAPRQASLRPCQLL